MLYAQPLPGLSRFLEHPADFAGCPDMTLFEVDEAANRIKEEVDPEANIIVGSTRADLQGYSFGFRVAMTLRSAGFMVLSEIRFAPVSTRRRTLGPLNVHCALILLRSREADAQPTQRVRPRIVLAGTAVADRRTT